jgi:hypothetical protein
MLLAACQPIPKLNHIQHVIAFLVELGRFAGGQQKRGLGFGITDSPAQTAERLAQVGAGGFVWHVGEEQAYQHLAPVGAGGFHRQKNQQSFDPLGPRFGHRFIVNCRLKTTKKVKYQMHGAF